MPMPMMPRVPTSRHLRGSSMSTMLRAKPSVSTPSLTTTTSVRAFTTSHIAPSALWELIGDGTSVSVAAILARFFSLRMAIAASQSAGGCGQSGPIRAQRRDAGADLADEGRLDRHVAVDLRRRVPAPGRGHCRRPPAPGGAFGGAGQRGIEF